MSPVSFLQYNEVSWQGLNIQIFKEVTITPPYRAENVVSTSNNKSLYNYIKKMVGELTDNIFTDMLVKQK